MNRQEDKIDKVKIINGVLVCPICGFKMQPTHTGNMKQHIQFKHKDEYPNLYRRTQKYR